MLDFSARQSRQSGRSIIRRPRARHRQGVAHPGNRRRPARWSNLLGSYLLRDGTGVNGLQEGTLALAAQVSAVAAAKGTSANAKYQNGVAVFTLGKGGLMFEASVGGQKFAFEPFGKK